MSNNRPEGRKPPQTPTQRRQKARAKLRAAGLTEHLVIVPDAPEAKAAINLAAAELVAGLSGQEIRN